MIGLVHTLFILTFIPLIGHITCILTILWWECPKIYKTLPLSLFQTKLFPFVKLWHESCNKCVIWLLYTIFIKKKHFNLLYGTVCAFWSFCAWIVQIYMYIKPLSLFRINLLNFVKKKYLEVALNKWFD